MVLISPTSDCRWVVPIDEAESVEWSFGALGSKVGPRKGRTQEEREDFCLRELLLAWGKQFPEQFPMSVYATLDRPELKRPDAILVYGNHQLGIEVVEAGNSAFQTWMTKFESGEFGKCASLPEAESISSALSDILAAIHAKAAKAEKGAYSDTPHLELVIYDNTSWLGFQDKRHVVRAIRDNVPRCAYFARVHIIFSTHVVLDILGEKPVFVRTKALEGMTHE